jgi:hypothetical protein
LLGEVSSHGGQAAYAFPLLDGWCLFRGKRITIR